MRRIVASAQNPRVRKMKTGRETRSTHAAARFQAALGNSTTMRPSRNNAGHPMSRIRPNIFTEAFMSGVEAGWIVRATLAGKQASQTVDPDEKRRLNAVTRMLSAFAEIISSGENPFFHASQSVISNSTVVIRIFGQAFRLHWPRQTSCKLEENGARYGIGHW